MKTTKRFILIAAAVMLAIFTVGCSFSFSTAKIEDAIMTDSIDAEGKPGEEVVSYPADAQTLYASAKIKNAPDNTKIRIVWTYVTENQLIDEVTMDSGDMSDRYIYSDLTPTAILPLGDYKVEFFIEDREEPDAVVKFVIVAAENAVSAADYSLYTSNAGKFSIQYPSDWVLQEFDDATGAMIYPADYSIKDEPDINTVYAYEVAGAAVGYTLDTALQSWDDETVAENLKDYAFVSKGTDTVNGNDIAYFAYDYTRGNYKLSATDFIVVKGDNLFVIRFMTTADEFNALYPYVEQMVLSFQTF